MSDKQKNIFISLAISIFVLVANSWHVLYQWMHNPSGRFYTWIAHYYADYFLYVSQIAQGVRGNWVVASSMYSNETIPDTWVYWPNVLIGKIGSIVSTSPFILYSASLLLFVAVLLLLLHTVTRLLFPKQPDVHLLAFLFCATASNFADLPALISKGEFSLTHEMWFSPTPALNRFGGVPHQTLQTILLVSVILLCTRLLNYPQRIRLLTVNSVLFTVVCFLAATISPIQMLLICMAIVLSLIILKPKSLFVVSILPGLLAAAFGAYIVNHAFDTSPLYAVAKTWEASQGVTASLVDLFLAMGPIILFLPFGIRRFRNEMTPLQYLLFLYGILSVIIFASPIPHILGTSPTRWIHPASFVIWYAIAAAGVFDLSTLLTRLCTPFSSKRARIYRYVSSAFILLYLFLTVPAILAQVAARSTPEAASILYSDVNHIPSYVVSTLTTLKTLPNTGVVLTDPILPYDAIVPILTGKRSFTGHPVHTLFPQVKEHLRQQFFMGTMNEETARQFLSDHSIRYIIASTQATKILPSYPFMKPSYYNEAITIYETAK